MYRRYLLITIAGLIALCLLAIVIYNLPPVHERLSYRVDTLIVQIRRAINPPEEVVFVPQEQVDAIVAETLTAMAPTPIPLPEQTQTPSPTPLPSLTPTAIPASVSLSGIRHEYQQFNNCAPASLSMVLSYWGWSGDQYQTRAYLRPSYEADDKNVNPFEMVAFVQQFTEYDALWRVGGDQDLLKRLVAAGFPVLIEKGVDPHDDSWLGHFQVISGYNDASGQFLVYDSLEGPPQAYGVPYDGLVQAWRHFNYAYVVVFPPEREADIHAALGAHSDPQESARLAAERARMEANSLTGREQFFAWFNLGASLLQMQDYAGATQAYDNAFALYASLSLEERPWRLLWYVDGPYAAYYHTGRYQDVINLAEATLINIDKPVLEETYYWRGMARLALGDQAGAIEDLQRAASLNPNSTPAQQELQRISS
jgi:hypothetical protein